MQELCSFPCIIMSSLYLDTPTFLAAYKHCDITIIASLQGLSMSSITSSLAKSKDYLLNRGKEESSCKQVYVQTVVEKLEAAKKGVSW